MIVLDTNHLDATPLGSLIFVMLRSIAREANHELAISAITYDEHVTHYSGKVRGSVAAIIDAYKQLKRFDPGVKIPTHYYEEADEIIANHEKELRETFRILEVSGGSAIEALKREARRIAPASTTLDTKGSGARDVAIWLSAIQYSVDSGEQVFLVSQDKAFKAALRQGDLEEYGGRVNVATDIQDLLDALATQAPVDLDVRSLCDSQTVRDALLISFGFYETIQKSFGVIEIPRIATVVTRHWTEQPELELIKITDVHGYVMGSSTWVTARSHWSVTQDVDTSVGAGEAENGPVRWRVTFRVSAALLLSIGRETVGVDVISVSDPTGLAGRIVSAGN